MRIRPFVEADLDELITLTITVFRPGLEGYLRPLLGDVVFQLHHRDWEQGYRDDVPTLHDPAAGRAVAVVEVDGTIAGYTAWRLDDKPGQGEVYLLAVAEAFRGRGVGRALCEHAINVMTEDGAKYLVIGTGDDAFHGSARRLYESLGFTKQPSAAYFKQP